MGNTNALGWAAVWGIQKPAEVSISQLNDLHKSENLNNNSEDTFIYFTYPPERRNVSWEID